MSLLFFQLVSAFLAYSCMLDTLLNILVAFLWPCFSKSMSLLKSMYSLSGVPGPDLALQMSLLHAEQRRITSPHLLTVHFLMQCRLVLAVCHRDTQAQGQLLVHPDPRSFFQSCFPASHCSACTGARDYSSPDAGLCISFYWTSQDFCQPISPLVQVPLNGSTPSWSIIHSSQSALGNKQEASPSEIARLYQVKPKRRSSFGSKKAAWKTSTQTINSLQNSKQLKIQQEVSGSPSLPLELPAPFVISWLSPLAEAAKTELRTPPRCVPPVVSHWAWKSGNDIMEMCSILEQIVF